MSEETNGRTNYQSIQGLVVPGDYLSYVRQWQWEKYISQRCSSVYRRHLITFFHNPDREKEGDDSSLCSTGSRGYRIKRWLGVRRSTWLLALYVAAYFSYLLGGCVLFAVLEQEVEKDVKVDSVFM